MRFVIPAVGGRKEVVIEATAAENINYFLKTPLTPATSAGATVKQVSVKGSQRRSWPGDTTTTTVSPSAREFLVDPTLKSGNGLGGYTFALVADPGLPGEERREFTMVRGTVRDLHAFLVGQAKMQLFFYGKSGARRTIDAATTP